MNPPQLSTHANCCYLVSPILVIHEKERERGERERGSGRERERERSLRPAKPASSGSMSFRAVWTAGKMDPSDILVAIQAPPLPATATRSNPVNKHDTETPRAQRRQSIIIDQGLLYAILKIIIDLSADRCSHLAVVSVVAPTTGPSKYGVGRPEDAGSRSKKLQLLISTGSLTAIFSEQTLRWRPSLVLSVSDFLQHSVHKLPHTRNAMHTPQLLFIALFSGSG